MSPAQSDSLDDAKSRLREDLRARRQKVSPALAEGVGARIAAALLANDRISSASRIAAYAAAGGEPDMRRFCAASRERGQRVALPRCQEGGQLRFLRVDDDAELVPGRFGLLEPPRTAPLIETDRIDVFIVPAVAVDPRGRRLGRGGGFYDRVLARQSPDALVIAAVHAFQVVAQVPAGPEDCSVLGWATETGLHWVSGTDRD